jgi:Ca2+-binding RTX toxin-like protein
MVWANPAEIFANADVITGSNLADYIVAYSGDDKITGRGGADQMFGGAGNDVYVVDGIDMVTENADEGIDEITSKGLIAGLTPNVENYSYTGLPTWAFIGDGVGNRLSGGRGNDTLDGATGNDSLLGNTGADLLIGGLDDDWLDGGIGNDVMKGGTGNDSYVIGSLGDVIDEEGNSDTDDLVRSTISVNLALFASGLIEHATLLGAGALKAFGNEADNALIGNKAANILDGQGGADTMIGDRGNDTYIVDDSGDQVSETIAGALGGIDLVKSSVSFVLGGNIEKLTLTGSGSINGTGNGLANTLTGNSGDNILDGAGGNDILKGAGGNDTYIVDSIRDVVSETVLNSNGGGIDAVISSVTYSLAARPNVEHLTLTGSNSINGTGNALGNTLTGNEGNGILNGAAGNDTLIGNGGNDTLNGGLGGDRLIGGDGIDSLNGAAGRDVFDYDHLTEAGDTITGFVLGAAGDVLDVADLLDEIGYAGSDAVGEGYIVFDQAGKNTIVSVDTDGSASGVNNPATLVTLLNVALSGANLDNYLV